MILRTPTRADCQLVGEWRNAPDVLPMLRTGHKSPEEQDRFYDDVICNPHSGHIYWSVTTDGGACVGLAGLTYLNEPESSPLANQITLVMGPESRGHGWGYSAVVSVLAAAFGPLALDFVQGECYAAGPTGFWLTCIKRMQWPSTYGIDSERTLRWKWTRPW